MASSAIIAKINSTSLDSKLLDAIPHQFYTEKGDYFVIPDWVHKILRAPER